MSTVTYPETFPSAVDAASAGQALWHGLCPTCGVEHQLPVRSAVPRPGGGIEVELDPCQTPIKLELRKRTEATS